MSARTLAGVLLVVLVAVALLFVATPHGIGISPDSTKYLSAARHILEGDLYETRGDEVGVTTHFPPGFAVALSAVTWLGLSGEGAARVLNAIALIVTGILTYALTRRASGGSTTAGLAGTVAVVFGRDILAAHSMVWSEPLFIPLTLGVLLATSMAIQGDSRRALVVAILLAGAAGLTRYAAPSVIGAAALAFLMLGRQPPRTRMVRAFTFATASSLPIGMLLAYNAMRASSATNRELAFHPPNLEQARSAASTVYYWVLPMRGPQWLEVALFAAIGLTVLVAVIAVFRSRVRHRRPFFTASPPDRAILMLFLVAYVLFLFFTLTFYDAQATPDARLLLPLVPPLAILIVAAITDALRLVETRRPAVALASALLIGLVCSTSVWVKSARRDGLGYSAPAWRSSPLMEAVRELPQHTTVFTNHPGAILVQGGRDAREVPRLASPTSLRPNADYERQMEAVCIQASSAPVAYAHFTTETLEWFLPSLADVRRYWRSKPRLVTPDGVLDTVPANCAGIVAGRR